METCVAACLACHRACLEGVVACLQKGGRHASPEHIKHLLDCAQICAVSADFMIRQSAHHAAVCSLCADICTACAASCDAVGGMAECAAACRKCAETCKAAACH